MTDAEFDALISERKCRKCGEEYEGEHVCKDVKDKAQTFALNTWLFDYPSDMTYEQIVEALDRDKWSEQHDGWKDKGIVQREVIDDGVCGEMIADYIRETFKRAMGLIGEVQRG
jgi:hypothetical protein